MNPTWPWVILFTIIVIGSTKAFVDLIFELTQAVKRRRNDSIDGGAAAT